MTVVGRSYSFHYMSVFDTSGIEEGRLSVCVHGKGLFLYILYISPIASTCFISWDNLQTELLEYVLF